MTEKKNGIIIILVLMAAVTQAGLVLYTPAFVQISEALRISSTKMEITLASYLVGFGISQIFYGPLSDCWGRKKLLLIGMFIFSIGCLWSVFVTNYSGLFFSRMVQGFGLGSCMTLSRAILRDVFDGDEYVSVASYLSSGFAIGLGVTPVIGGHLLDFFSWRSEFVFLLFCGLLLFIVFAIFLPETHSENRLSFGRAFYHLTIRNIFHSLNSKSFIGYLIAGVMAYGAVIAYNTMAPFLFQKTLGLNALSYGWLTLAVAIVYYLGTSSNRMIIRKSNATAAIRIGLLLMFIAGLAMLLFKVTLNSVNVVVIFLPALLAVYAQALIWSNCIAGALKDLSSIAGTAAAAFGCMQMLLSALISAIVAIPNEYNQVPFAITIIILSVLSACSFYWFVFKVRVNVKSNRKK